MSGDGAPESGWTNTRHNDGKKNGKSTRRSNTKNPKSMKLSDDDSSERKKRRRKTQTTHNTKVSEQKKDQNQRADC